MTGMPEHRWVFRARPGRVIDGDTIELEAIDLGFHATRTERLRLLDVDTPERGQAGWAEATAFVRAWLADAALGPLWPLMIETHTSDAFGRYLARVWRHPDGRELNRDLLDAGLARVWTRKD